MNNLEIKKTYLSDFEKIYPLLQEFNSPYSKDNWRKIFSYHWDGAEDYVGFHLEHKNDVVGFMGLIFSCRNKQNAQYKFCNITSLLVKQDYRAATFFLVRKLKTLENMILTGLRPINESYRILTLMGFSAYEHRYNIIPTIYCWFGKRNKGNIYDFPRLLEIADNENCRIALDHANLNCNLLLFESNGKQCLLIFKMTNQNHYKMNLQKILILYVSSVDFFNENIYAILNIFNRKLGPLSALYVDERFLQKKNLFSFGKEITPPRICYNPYQKKIDIDELYSETVLL